MLTKNLLKRGASLLASVALASTIFTGTALAESEKLEQPVLAPRVKSIIEADGYQFIDLNGNGTLDSGDLAKLCRLVAELDPLPETTCKYSCSLR